MNRRELERALILAGVPDDAYELDGGLPNEALVLNHQGARWEVYYSERGLKTSLVVHDTEQAACDDLWDRLEWAWRPDA